MVLRAFCPACQRFVFASDDAQQHFCPVCSLPLVAEEEEEGASQAG